MTCIVIINLVICITISTTTIRFEANVTISNFLKKETLNFICGLKKNNTKLSQYALEVWKVKYF